MSYKLFSNLRKKSCFKFNKLLISSNIAGAVCFDGIFIVIVVHCSALFEVLHQLLEHATDEEIPQSERVKYLLCCVRLHERIYRLL